MHPGNDQVSKAPATGDTVSATGLVRRKALQAVFRRNRTDVAGLQRRREKIFYVAIPDSGIDGQRVDAAHCLRIRRSLLEAGSRDSFVKVASVCTGRQHAKGANGAKECRQPRPQVPPPSVGLDLILVIRLLFYDYRFVVVDSWCLQTHREGLMTSLQGFSSGSPSLV